MAEAEALAHQGMGRPKGSQSGFVLMYCLLLLLALSLVVLTLATEARSLSAQKQAALQQLGQQAALRSALHAAIFEFQPTQANSSLPRRWAGDGGASGYELVVHDASSLLDINSVPLNRLSKWLRSDTLAAAVAAGRPYGKLDELPVAVDQLMVMGSCALVFNTGMEQPQADAGPDDQDWGDRAALKERLRSVGSDGPGAQNRKSGPRVLWIGALPQMPSRKALAAEILLTTRSDQPFQVLRWETVDPRWLSCR